MIRYAAFTLVLVLVSVLIGCETEEQIADRVIAERANMAEAEGLKVLSVKHDGSRRTVVALDGDMAIIFESSKHGHDVSVVEHFAEKSEQVAK